MVKPTQQIRTPSIQHITNGTMTCDELTLPSHSNKIMNDSQIKNSHDNIVAKSQINGHTSMVKHRKKKTKLIEKLNQCQQGTTVPTGTPHD